MALPISEQQLVEMLTRNLLPDIRQELLYVQVKSIANLRKMVQMRENLLGEVAFRRVPKTATNSAFPRRNVAVLDEEVPCQDEDPNTSEVAAVQAPIRVYRCWNCDAEGHGWDMCIKKGKVFAMVAAQRMFINHNAPGVLQKRRKTNRRDHP